MKHIYWSLILTTLFLGTGHRMSAQNLEEIGVKKGIKPSGSINLSAIGYHAWGTDNRRDPFNWFATGSLNLNLFGYNTPFTFSYSNTSRSFTQPFNQFSFSPQYKWVKTYIGYNSMTFSQYTLSGHTFLGGGVELSPGKWRIAAMYGRLKKGIPYNLQDSTLNYNVAYKRMGYAWKVGYEDGGNMISLSFFSAKDDIRSLPYVLPESDLTPKQNIAVSINGKKTLFSHFFVECEYALSALNKDIRANRSDSVVQGKSSNLFGKLLPDNPTNRYFDAFAAGVGYQGNIVSLQARYQRVAPEYETLGAYYFNNDMENITLAPSLKLLQSRLTLAGNVGIQYNNLDKSRAFTTKRWVSAVNVNFMPDQNWNLTGSYSNFATYTNRRPQTDPFFQNNLDTLNFYQISQTFNGSAGYMFGSKEHKQSVMLLGSYQQTGDNSQSEGGQSSFYTANLSYSHAFSEKGASLSGSVNYNVNTAALVKSVYWGPNVSWSQSLFNKQVRSSLASAYNKAFTNGVVSNDVVNARWSLSYQPKPGQSKKAADPAVTESAKPSASGTDTGKSKGKGFSGNQNISLGINWMKRLHGTTHQPAFSELTATLGYTYSF